MGDREERLTSVGADEGDEHFDEMLAARIRFLEAQIADIESRRERLADAVQHLEDRQRARAAAARDVSGQCPATEPEGR